MPAGPSERSWLGSGDAQKCSCWSAITGFLPALSGVTERRAFHVAIVALVLLDLASIITSVILELTYPLCGRVISSKVPVAASEKRSEHEEELFFISRGSHHGVAAGPTVVVRSEDFDRPRAVRHA